MLRNLVSGWLTEGRRYRKPQDWADRVRPDKDGLSSYSTIPEELKESIGSSLLPSIERFSCLVHNEKTPCASGLKVG